MTSRASSFAAIGLLLAFHAPGFAGSSSSGTTAVSATVSTPSSTTISASGFDPRGRAEPARWGSQHVGTAPPAPRARRPSTFSLPAGSSAADVVRPFDRPAQDWLPGHRGVDLKAGVGSDIRAPGDGIVTFSGSIAGRGVLVVAHARGLRSSFEPISDPAQVGTAVQVGDSLGVLAETAGHCEPSSCLHWGVRLGERYLDPMALTVSAHAVLLPWD